MQSYLNNKEYYDPKARAAPLKINENCFILQPIADHQASKFPFQEFHCVGPYFDEKVLANKHYIVRKLNSNKTQVLHRICIRKYESNSPLSDVHPERILQPETKLLSRKMNYT